MLVVVAQVRLLPGEWTFAYDKLLKLIEMWLINKILPISPGEFMPFSF
jgi:hypothetical protein